MDGGTLMVEFYNFGDDVVNFKLTVKKIQVDIMIILSNLKLNQKIKKGIDSNSFL